VHQTRPAGPDRSVRPGSWLYHILPGAQPAACALFLIGARVVEHFAGDPAAFPLHVLAYLAGGTGSAITAWGALRRRRVDVNLLMLIAALGAASIGQWDEGGILLFLFSLSNAMEFYAVGRTRRAIRALMDLRPREARARRNGKEVVIAVEHLRVGDVIIVRPAERLPADGIVAHGASSIDQSPITGESIPVDVGPGAPVFAGTINQRGSLEIQVTKEAEDATLARIIALVEEAQSAQAPSQRLIDRFGQVYAIAVILGAIAAYAVFIAMGFAGDAAFYRAITLLVVASPCALVIATPATVLSAIANAARRGILFKGGVHIERLADVGIVVFDKTGTLTMGRPEVTDVVPLAVTEETLLEVAGSIEQRSEHALAEAVVTACRQRGVALVDPQSFESVTGRGVRGVVGNQTVRVGSEQFMRDEAVAISEQVAIHLSLLRERGRVPILVANQTLLGIFAVADTLRPQAHSAIRALRALGIRRIVMLTGDHHQVAEAVAKQLEVDEIRADLLPEQKADVVKGLTREGVVAMVGDGVNDAPALATADIGVAMGAAGTDAAMETADLVLMGDDLYRLPEAIQLSRQARRVIKQNLAFAACVIAVLIMLTFAVGLRLALGVVGHEGSTVLVVFNGLRLLRFRPTRV
jgi:Cd2+/Zn2+-exporting ATPase